MEDIILETKGETMSEVELKKAHAMVEAIGNHKTDGVVIILEAVPNATAGAMFAHNMPKIRIIQTLMKAFKLSAEEMAVIAKLND